MNEKQLHGSVLQALPVCIVVNYKDLFIPVTGVNNPIKQSLLWRIIQYYNTELLFHKTNIYLQNPGLSGIWFHQKYIFMCKLFWIILNFPLESVKLALKTFKEKN